MTCVPWNMQEYCLVSGQDSPPTAMQGSRAAIHSRQGHGLGRHVRMVWGAQCGLETLTPLEYANKMSKIQVCHERKNLKPDVYQHPVSDLVTALIFQGRKRELCIKKAELWSPLGAVIGSSSYLGRCGHRDLLPRLHVLCCSHLTHAGMEGSLVGEQP